MISLPELLNRFRRAWAPPGPPRGLVAPPADVAARLRAEVQHVLDAIAEIQRRADTELAEADAASQQQLDAAAQTAKAAVRDAEQRAPDARSKAAEEKHRAVDAEIASVLAGGQEEARRIAAQAKDRLPPLVTSVCACVQAVAGAKR
ncbi:MAG: hypothetical protein ACREPM_09675 [Gemmatimonadaceae bacterium]